MKWNLKWGSFDLNGKWYPNPHLQMSADEQYRQNKLAEANRSTPPPQSPSTGN
jgi:hypothetical protein